MHNIFRDHPVYLNRHLNYCIMVVLVDWGIVAGVRVLNYRYHDHNDNSYLKLDMNMMVSLYHLVHRKATRHWIRRKMNKIQSKRNTPSTVAFIFKGITYIWISRWWWSIWVIFQIFWCRITFRFMIKRTIFTLQPTLSTCKAIKKNK